MPTPGNQSQQVVKEIDQMGKLVGRSNHQRWRYLIYAVILIYGLSIYYEDHRSQRADSDNAGHVFEDIKDYSGMREKTGGRVALAPNSFEPLNLDNVTSGGTLEIIGSQNIDFTEAAADDHADYGDPDIDHLTETEVEHLLNERNSIYEETRTLTTSEIAALHGVKDNEDYPFAVSNEAQLILRELAIEYRIPHECAEEMTFECFDILERSQAGSIPFECQNPTDQNECENAFVRFWES